MQTNFQINRTIKKTSAINIIAAIILIALAFTFLHSEFGLFNFDGDNHGTHDYCEIVKTATTKIAKDVSKDLLKLTVEKSICFHCVDETNQLTKSITILDSEQCYANKKTTPVYLFNRTFLI